MRSLTSLTHQATSKKRKTYKLTFAQKFFSAKDSAYIELVDEMYGVAKYLKKVGKIGKANMTFGEMI